MSSNRKGLLGGYTENNSVNIIRGGSRYFEKIAEIAAGATYSLHFQTYIFDEDETGRFVANAMMGAAKRGVLVYMLIDAYASQHLSAAFIEELRSSGVHFRFFEPFLRNKVYYFGRRMHHKILVADGNVCLVGGMNVSNRYNDMPEQPAWLDWALHVRGDVAIELNNLCIRIWNRAVFHKSCTATKPPIPIAGAGTCKVRLSRNDWVYKKTQISRNYREIFRTATSSVTIMTSYFWPPTRLLRTIEAARKRGVEITIILTGRADVPLAKYSERYLYRRLFRSNITIYEYTSNVLHGKLAVKDGEWLTVGSYNLNNISAFASVELNLDVADTGVAMQMTDALKDIMQNDCKQITKDDFEASGNIIKRFMYFLSYQIIHMLFFLFTFYFSQRPVSNDD